MVESEPVDNPKKGKKIRKCGHLKLKVIRDLKSSTFESEAREAIAPNAAVVMDNFAAHAGVEEAVADTERARTPRRRFRGCMWRLGMPRR